MTVAGEEHEWKDGVCEECKYVCQHKDDNNDHLCDICDEKVSDHTGGKATCIAKAVCTTCGQSYGEVDSSNHTGKEEWIQTEEKHEKKWNCCNLVTVAGEEHEWKDGVCEECKYVCQHKDDNHDHLCDICNKKISDHIGGTATCKDLAICDVCGEPYGKLDQNNHAGGRQIRNAEEATCTKEGYTGDIYCNGCGDKLSSGSVTKSLGHKDTNKDHFCDVCNTKISEHIGGIATCIAKAVCAECGMEYGEIDSKNHDLKHHEAKAATCTEIGWNAYDTCKREGCDYTTYKEVAALNHDLEHHEAKAATCTEIGWEAYDTCKREGCGYTTYVELPALNHDLEHHEAKAATCTEIGWEAYDTCKREGCTYSTYKELPALNHDLEHHEAKAATCTEIGWEAYDTCKREGCKYSTYKEIAALDHDLEHHEAKAATCTEIGWEAYDTCKREGCKYTTYKELPALGHEDSNNDHFCDACSTKISDHSYESKIAREATTTYTGIRIYTCTKCGHSYTEELAKLPSQTNQADQTNQIEPANNGNEKDFIGTVTSVFLNVTDFAAKNFRISFWLMIQMLLKAVMQLW